MSTTYCVNISMDPQTRDCLRDANCSLFVFKAVSGPCQGAPLVWAKVSSYGENIPVTWEDKYQAYSSFSPIQATQAVFVNNSYSIDLGSLFTIENSAGVGEVTHSGYSPAGICIANLATQAFTCGIQESIGSEAHPPSAFTLSGQMGGTICPVQTVLLMFSSSALNRGDVMTFSDSQCVTIDLSRQSTRAITYTINLGWKTNNEAGMTIYQPYAPLTPLLILPSVRAHRLR
jgi:hypothetical protein